MNETSTTVIQNQLSQKVFEFEKEFPVHQIFFRQEIPVWPILRVLAHYWIGQINRKDENNQEKDNQVLKTYNWQKYLLEIATPSKGGKGPESKILSEPAQGDVVFISSLNYRRFCVEDGLYDVLIDPFIDILKDQKISYSIIEYGDKPLIGLPRCEYTFYLQPVIDQARMQIHQNFNQLFNSFEIQEPDYYKRFVNYLETQKYQKKYSPWIGILKAIALLKLLTNYYLNLFNKHKPKLVMVVCWWGIQNMAAILAARILKIPSMDIQHGGLSYYHIPNRFWSKQPPKDYTIVPDFFWAWGTYFKDLIIKENIVFNKNNVIAGGFPWLLLWREKYNPEITKTRQTFKNIYLSKNDKKNILCTLAGYIDEEEVASFVKEIIKSLPIECRWYIRIHPGQFFKSDSLQTYFQDRDNVDVIDACKLPLYVLFDLASVHLSWGSTTTYESLAMNIPTIVVHEIGQARNADILSKEFLPFSTNPSEIAELILSYIEHPDIMTEKKEIISKEMSYFFSRDWNYLKDILLNFIATKTPY